MSTTSSTTTTSAVAEAIKRRDEAIAFARTYAGDFSFMISMRSQATDPQWKPTDKQIAAILRCKGHQEKEKSFKVKLSPVRTSLWNGGPSGWITVAMTLSDWIREGILDPIMVTRHMSPRDWSQRQFCASTTRTGERCQHKALLGIDSCGTHATRVESARSATVRRRLKPWVAEDGSTWHAIVREK